MDAVQVLASATQLVSAMVTAVGALEQAAADLAEAPRRLQVLEDFVSDLDALAQQARQRHAHKMHSPQLERQFQSLGRLMDQLRANIAKARQVLSRKGRGKGFARVVRSSVVGDPLMKYVKLIRDDLNWWLELQELTQSVGDVIASTAKSTPSLVRVKSEHGYPVSKKCSYVRKLLERDGGHRVVLIVGLSGIGKSCLARQIASDPPGNFVDGAIEISFGRWCSRAACNGSRSEYHKRLVRKICKFLVQIGSMAVNEEVGKDLDDVCFLLQTALVGRSMLILLDDVWEQDIVDRFTKLYDNDCQYLVTTRDEAIYEIAVAEKVEISKDDIKEISKEILLYHSLLSVEELPVCFTVCLDGASLVSAALSHLLAFFADTSLHMFICCFNEGIPAVKKLNLYIIIFFQEGDYIKLAQSLETAGSIDKLIDLLGVCEDTSTLANFSSVLAKISKHVDATVAEEILSRIPMDRIADLLSPENEQWHEIVFATLASLTKVGKMRAVETMIESGVDKKLLVLLGNGSEISQHHAILLLKTFCELGAPLQGCMGPAVMVHLPWRARISLERFFLFDQSVSPSPKPQQSFEVILHKILQRDTKDIIEAIQGLLPLAERANDSRVQDLLLGSNLFDRLAFLLQRREVESNQVRSQTAFLVMKLACTGGKPYVHRFLELNIVHDLINMMQCNIDELQDSAYYALHQIVFAKGGSLVLQRFLQLGTIEKLVNLLDRKSLKTKDLSMQLLVDIAVVGTKPCIERMLTSQVVEKLVALEKAGEPFGGAVSRYIQGLNMCKNVQSAERAVMKQHILRKVRSAVRGHKLEASLVASVEASIAEGSKGTHVRVLSPAAAQFIDCFVQRGSEEMAGLQRSAQTFRRSGSSGLVWDERFLTDTEGAGGGRRQPELRHSRSVGSMLWRGEAAEHGDKKRTKLVVLAKPRQHKDQQRKQQQELVPSGRKAFRTRDVAPAAEPPSPRVPGCCAPCAIFRGSAGAGTAATASSLARRAKPRRR
ncbi:hypothetical protein BAE44_0013360 [Dichanthelium oligosanthes]|uniref:NB-ARC domain-containing protein n=1 Tax=Dichanthelium oligosanthes TaxID=888268 RepID=A0A1E5VKG6_9POAL|nr:hypothetical protein BAE44_0013360 [Dichanthelium oligosanthes]